MAPARADRMSGGAVKGSCGGKASVCAWGMSSDTSACHSEPKVECRFNCRMMGVLAMYRIGSDKKRIKKIPESSFADLGVKERDHLQEWIANEPDVLGEELLIIQKEFADFSGTNERLDLLALDKDGTLVIIENKLDDSGKDVTWQALKYASYCSTLSEEQIREIYQEFLTKENNEEAKAEEKISKFYDYKDISLNKSATPRIILIAGDFRPEVTSTVLWLSNNFGVRLQCFKATAYSLDEGQFIHFEQIIPTQGAEDYTIRMAEKTQNDINSQAKKSRESKMRRAFWEKLIEAMSKKTDLFQNTSPGQGIDTWITAGSGVDRLGFNFVVTQTYGKVELNIHREDWEESKRIFEELQKKKEQIASRFERPLSWKPSESRGDCRIASQVTGNVINEDRWDGMIEFMTDSMVKMEKVFSPLIKKIDEQLKNNPSKNK